MLNLSLKVLKLIAKNRSIKGYKRMSKNKLINSLKASKPIKRNYQHYQRHKKKQF